MSGSATSKLRVLAALAGLFAAWSLSVWWVGVEGEFPLNDDFAYARIVTHLLEHGEFRRISWTFTPSLTNVWVGYAATRLAGFSFEVLRLTGVAWGAVNLVATFALLRRSGAACLPAVFGAAIVGFTPIIFNLTLTFMTDVPFLALVTASGFFLLGALRTGSWIDLVLGTVLAAAATVIRQPGLALPLAFALAVVWKQPRAWQSWLAAGLATGIVGSAYLVCEAWVGSRGPDTFGITHVVSHVTEGYPLYHAVSASATIFIYLGWFLLPLLPLVGLRRRLWMVGMGVVGAVAVCTVLAVLDRPLPPGNNIIHARGLGPVTLPGEAVPLAPEGVWWVACAIGGWTAVALLAAWIREAGWKGLQAPELVFLIGFAGIFLAPHMVRAPFFGRYAVMALPFVLAAFLHVFRELNLRPLAVGAALVALFAMASFSVMGTRDYLERARTTQVVISELLARGAKPTQIHAGLEYNGWNYHFDQARYPKELGGYREPVRFWPSGEYKVSLDENEPDHVLETEAVFRKWLPPGTETIYGFRRVGPPEVRPWKKPAS